MESTDNEFKELPDIVIDQDNFKVLKLQKADNTKRNNILLKETYNNYNTFIQGINSAVDAYSNGRKSFYFYSDCLYSDKQVENLLNSLDVKNFSTVCRKTPSGGKYLYEFYFN